MGSRESVAPVVTSVSWKLPESGTLTVPVVGVVLRTFCPCAGVTRMGTSAAPRAIIEATRRVDANFRDDFTFSQPFTVWPNRPN